MAKNKPMMVRTGKGSSKMLKAQAQKQAQLQKKNRLPVVRLPMEQM